MIFFSMLNPLKSKNQNSIELFIHIFKRSEIIKENKKAIE